MQVLLTKLKIEQAVDVQVCNYMLTVSQNMYAVYVILYVNTCCGCCFWDLIFHCLRKVCFVFDDMLYVPLGLAMLESRRGSYTINTM